MYAMFVITVDTGACGSYTALYTVYCTLLSIKWPLTPGRRAICYLKTLLSWGLAVHQSVLGGSFSNFLELVNYTGYCRQGTQPFPNS